MEHIYDFSEIMGEERFFSDDRYEWRWIYFNPDAACGAQFVMNCFTADDVESAIQFASNDDGEYRAIDVFAMLESLFCRQHLFDIGTPEYSMLMNTFCSEPLCEGLNESTLTYIQ